ncbi:MAG: PEGA domain-containing protein, partial [Myxococcales bacterium]|nr:PEGA domain-containing protein [Myxococcales bacterium]
WLFEAADHLEAGEPAAVAAVIGRKQLARLNFAAGQRAFDGADWDTARRYFAAAYDRLKPEVTTASTGGLSMSAAVATGLRLAQSLTLIGNHEDAKTLFETLEGWQLSEDEAAELVARRVQSELLSGHYQQAMARGLAALRRQGIEIPARISKLDIGIEVFRRWRDIHEVSREDWLARPMADDVGTINLSRLIAAIKSVAYLADKPLFVLLSGIHVRVAAGPALDELGALALAELAISVAFGLRKPEAAAAGFTLQVTPADAKVLVDGKEVTGGNATGLSEGSHTIEVSKDGFLPHKQELALSSGQTLPVPIKLHSANVALTIKVEPATASVTLLSGDTPTEIGKGAPSHSYALVRQPDVAYTLKGSATGYEDTSLPITFTGDPTQELTLTLTPSNGGGGGGEQVAVNDKPAKKKSGGGGGGGSKKAKTAELKIGVAPGNPPADVYVDGRKMGRSPQFVKVTAGSHTVKWKWDDGKSDTQKVSVGDKEVKLLKGSK